VAIDRLLAPLLGGGAGAIVVACDLDVMHQGGALGFVGSVRRAAIGASGLLDDDAGLGGENLTHLALPLRWQEILPADALGVHAVLIVLDHLAAGPYQLLVETLLRRRGVDHVGLDRVAPLPLEDFPRETLVTQVGVDELAGVGKNDHAGGDYRLGQPLGRRLRLGLGHLLDEE